MKNFLYFLLGGLVAYIVFNSESNSFQVSGFDESQVEQHNPRFKCVDAPEVPGLSRAEINRLSASNDIHLFLDVITYAFRDDVLEHSKEVVEAEFRSIEKFTKVKFVKVDWDQALFRITDQKSGAWAYVGYTLYHPSLAGLPTMNFDRDWIVFEGDGFGPRVVYHEVMHGIGFPHWQHSRDRCIQPDTVALLAKGWTLNNIHASYRYIESEHYLNFPYPFTGSLMHYWTDPNDIINEDVCDLLPSMRFATTQDTLMMQTVLGKPNTDDSGVDDFTCEYQVGDYVYYLRRASMAPSQVEVVVPEPEKNRCRYRLDLVNSNYPPVNDGSRMIKIHNQEVIDYYFGVDESLSDSDRLFLDEYGSEIDRLNVILRSLE